MVGKLPEFEELDSATKVAWIAKAFVSFPFFISHIFPYSWKLWAGNEDGTWLNPPEGVWVPASHLERWAQEKQENKLTAKLCARAHLKSTHLYAHVMWKLWRCQDTSFEGLYISYNETMASYHTGNVKKLVKSNPWFSDVVDLTQAETFLNYSWKDIPKNEEGDYRVTFSVTPAGILAFKRGRHPRVVWADDILADPKNPLNLSTINTITTIFFEDVMSLPQRGGELHLAGTPQDDNDVFFQIKKRGRVKTEDCLDGFHWTKEPAILDNVRKTVIWPELFPYEELLAIKQTILEKAFNKEYLCSPVRSEEGFFKRKELEDLVDLGLEYVSGLNTDNNVWAGWDLGKKQHPSHFSVFEMVGSKAVQRYEVFWDGVDFSVQLGRVMRLKERLMIDKVAYDSTRGEFAVLEEQGRLPGWLMGINFTTKSKQAMASALETRVGQKTMNLLGNPRQINVMLQVQNDLRSIETDEGHGDSFWSNGLAMWLAEQPADINPGIVMEMDGESIEGIGVGW